VQVVRVVGVGHQVAGGSVSLADVVVVVRASSVDVVEANR
jgi:hypothetical protein